MFRKFVLFVMVALASVGAVGATTASAKAKKKVAAKELTGGTLYACVGNLFGEVRIVSSSTKCFTWETKTS